MPVVIRGVCVAGLTCTYQSFERVRSPCTQQGYPRFRLNTDWLHPCRLFKALSRLSRGPHFALAHPPLSPVLSMSKVDVAQPVVGGRSLFKDDPPTLTCWLRWALFREKLLSPCMVRPSLSTTLLPSIASETGRLPANNDPWRSWRLYVTSTWDRWLST